MKFKLFLLSFYSLFLFNCSQIEELLEEEEEVNQQIEGLEGEWQLVSVTNNELGQALFIDEDYKINDCEEPMVCEFISSSNTISGSYTGNVIFWPEELDSCNPETFEGSWRWNNDTELLFLDINSTSSDEGYSNNFALRYFLDVDDDNFDTDIITFTFTNENEGSQTTYIFEKMN